jgi:hypothetical protein
MTTTELQPRAVTPVPAGRGRWRLTLHSRQFVNNVRWDQTLIAELVRARGRRLDQTWNAPAQLTFTLDGDAPTAGLVRELQTDVMAWRWDENTGQDVAMFRGIVTHAEDQLNENTNVVTFTCQDYGAMLQRRIATVAYAYNDDQDVVVNQIMTWGQTNSGGGTNFAPGWFLPINSYRTNPDGTPRAGLTGQTRIRNYAPQTVAFQALDDLAHVQGGFDWDVVPAARLPGTYYVDALRVFYPRQGVTRNDVALVYGSTVSGLTRTVNSADYANYVRVIGNNGSADPAAPQVYGEAWNTDANNVTVNPVGLWQTGLNAADVTLNQTLQDQAAGLLALDGTLVASWNVTMRPDAYQFGYPNMGDVVPLIVVAGRLNVNTQVRVVAISYAPTDDGDEQVSLTVGRPAVQSIAGQIDQNAQDVADLARK